MRKRDLSYLTGILLVFAFLLMLVSGFIQLRFELHRFIYHIYTAYLLIILTLIHLLANWKKISGIIKNKIDFQKGKTKASGKSYISDFISIVLVLSFILTLSLGFLQVRLNFPHTRFVYHIYSAYITLILALIHICFNLNKVMVYLAQRKKFVGTIGGVLIIAVGTLGIKLLTVEEKTAYNKISSMKFVPSLKYHEKTKHTYAEIVTRTGGAEWSKMPSVFKEYPRGGLIKLSTDFDFDSVSVEQAIETASFKGSFSEEPITESELSRLLYHTNGITGEIHYPGLTYYLRAAPSAGALYPTVIYLVINNVEGFKKGIYHYSVKEHSLHLLKQGDFIERIASWTNNPTLLREASVVFIMSNIFYRTKWKYHERGYRYVLLDTGHLAGNLMLMAKALGLGSYSIGTFIDDKINEMLDIDGLKEAVVYINAVGREELVEQEPNLKMSVLKKVRAKKLPEGLTIAELIHESGKLGGFTEIENGPASSREEMGRAVELSYKSYPQAKKIYLSKEFSKQGLSLDDTIRKRRSARDYSRKPISQSDLSRLLYYTYGHIKNTVKGYASNGIKRAVESIEGLYPIELYVVVNNVEGTVRGVYHYDVLEHALELLKEGDYRFRIANACLGQELVGRASVAIIKTALFERVKHYGDRGYRYVHLDAGVIGENIYLEAVSMGLGVCGIGAFFDDQINEMLGIDGINEAVIYVTSVGKLS